MSAEELFAVVRLTMKALKEQSGLDPKDRRPTLQRAGAELGHVVSKSMRSNDVEGVLSELSASWGANNLGEMQIVSESPLTLEVRNCFDCLGVGYGVGVTLCGFKEGFIKAVLDDRLGTHSEVTEVECCGTRAQHCRFEVNLAPK